MHVALVLYIVQNTHHLYINITAKLIFHDCFTIGSPYLTIRAAELEKYDSKEFQQQFYLQNTTHNYRAHFSYESDMGQIDQISLTTRYAK